MSRFFGPVRQLGLVVRDLDAAMAYWTDVMGIGPFFARRGTVFENYRYRGKPGPAPIIDTARTFSGDFNIELIAQLNDAPSAYTEFYASGREGAQHMAFWYDSAGYDVAYAKAMENGLTVVMEGAMNAGNVRGRWCYLQRGDGDPVMVEFSEALNPIFVPVQNKQIEAAAAWDGRDPVR